MISRRDFGKAALAGIPLSAAWSADTARFGWESRPTASATWCARPAGQCRRCDPSAPTARRARDRTVVVQHRACRTEQRARRPAAAFRLSRPGPDSVACRGRGGETGGPQRPADLAPRHAGVAAHEAFRAKFEAAGINLFAYRVDYDASFTDEEIDVTFQQAKALGASRIASLTTLSGARRLAPVRGQARDHGSAPQQSEPQGPRRHRHARELPDGARAVEELPVESRYRQLHRRRLRGSRLPPGEPRKPLAPSAQGPHPRTAGETKPSAMATLRSRMSFAW